MMIRSFSSERFQEHIPSTCNNITNDHNRNDSRESYERRAEKIQEASRALERTLSLCERNSGHYDRKFNNEQNHNKLAHIESGSQSQWQEFLDQGILISHAVEELRKNGDRGLNKGSFLFNYSSDGPSSPVPYNVSTDTELIRLL